jgi:hypothetical protein
MKHLYLTIAMLCPVMATAQLAATVSSPKVTDQKAVIELIMKNNFTEQIESARAICFLIDDQGKLIGESAKWVIGGVKKRPALKPNKETSFNFVITGNQPLTTTNLTAKVNFSRVVLENNKLADPKTDVQIVNLK